MVSPLNIVFRADASLDIGTGHVMRCLTLADELRCRGAVCSFICRDLPGHLAEAIRSRRYDVTLLLSPAVGQSMADTAGPPHAAWLGVPWSLDMEQTRHALSGKTVDWLVVDHYALDARWQAGLRSDCRRLMVIDDLADRSHLCDLLLDQNLGRVDGHYEPLVPSICRMLIGPRCALLRPEFAACRQGSLRRRRVPELQQLLVSLGGVDKFNITARVLEALAGKLSPECRIKVVLGAGAPWVEQVRRQAQSMTGVEVLVGVTDMAGLMVESDLAIGAAGTTAWERCCLGLPTITLVLAANQRQGASALAAAGAIRLCDESADLSEEIREALAEMSSPEARAKMALACSSITDGSGAGLIAEAMLPGSVPGCRIRPMVDADLVQVLSWRNHPDIRRFMLTQHQISLEEHRRWFAKASRDPLRTLLIVEEGDTPLGFVHFNGVVPGGAADWGFYVVPGAPKGSGRKLGRAALNHAFGVLGLDKVCGQALAGNEASIGLHRSLGFREEGMLQNPGNELKGSRDLLCFGLSSEDWTGLPEKSAE